MSLRRQFLFSELLRFRFSDFAQANCDETQHQENTKRFEKLLGAERRDRKTQERTEGHGVNF